MVQMVGKRSASTRVIMTHKAEGCLVQKHVEVIGLLRTGRSMVAASAAVPLNSCKRCIGGLHEAIQQEHI